MLRTYTRKPPECRYIEGVLGLCRLCLQRAEEAVPIFTEDHGDICSSLALRIMICVGLELKREDALPNHICLGCYKDLELYYAFRKKCEVSYQKLKYHIQAIQNKKMAETLMSVTEEAIKNIDVEAEENVNPEELQLTMETAESYGIVKTDVAPVINDEPIDVPVEIKEANVKEEKITKAPALSPQEAPDPEPAGLPSMLVAVLVKLGLLTRAGRLLARAGAPAGGLQLHTADGAVVRMELVEEDDDGTTVTEQEESCPDEQAEADFCIVSATQDDSRIMSTDDQGEVKIISDDVKSEKATRRRRRGGAGAECARCGRVLASASALRRHARTHSGERPFACARCPRRFAQREVMRRHMLVHDEVRPHACSECPKSFTQRAALERHARGHRPPHERALRLHACARCPKLFLHCSGLSRHMMSHAGRVFECGACQRQFADRSSVLRHVRRAHAPDDAEAPPQAT